MNTKWSVIYMEEAHIRSDMLLAFPQNVGSINT